MDNMDKFLASLACHKCIFDKSHCKEFKDKTVCKQMLSDAKELILEAGMYIRTEENEDKYTIDQIMDALLQDDDDIITAIRQRHKEMLREMLMNYLK